MQNFEPYDKPFWEKSMWHRKKNNHKYSGYFVSLQRLRAAHALRSDQKIMYYKVIIIPGESNIIITKI